MMLARPTALLSTRRTRLTALALGGHLVLLLLATLLAGGHLTYVVRALAVLALGLAHLLTRWTRRGARRLAHVTADENARAQRLQWRRIRRRTRGRTRGKTNGRTRRRTHRTGNVETTISTLAACALARVLAVGQLHATRMRARSRVHL